MKQVTHPSEIISTPQVKILRDQAAQAEQAGALTPEQLSIIHENNWFNLFVPGQYGGSNLGLPAALRLEEALAWIEGSLGWTVTLCAGAAWFVGFLEGELAAQVFSEANVCLAGSGKAGGIARSTSSGFSVTGQWDYASGAPFASAFTANCLVEENGVQLQDEAGEPVVKAFVFFRKDVLLHKNWNTIGMQATASHGFSVEGLKVPENRAFVIDAKAAVLPGVIFQYPFLQLAETTIAANSSGMCRHFIECCAGMKQTPVLQSRVGPASERLEQLRQVFYKNVGDSWISLQQYNSIPNELLARVSESSKVLAVECRQIVDELYPYCGMQAANPATEINRVWRDMHTASQHVVFAR